MKRCQASEISTFLLTPGISVKAVTSSLKLRLYIMYFMLARAFELLNFIPSRKNNTSLISENYPLFEIQSISSQINVVNKSYEIVIKLRKIFVN